MESKTSHTTTLLNKALTILFNVFFNIIGIIGAFTGISSIYLLLKVLVYMSHAFNIIAFCLFIYLTIFVVLSIMLPFVSNPIIFKAWSIMFWIIFGVMLILISCYLCDFKTDNTINDREDSFGEQVKLKKNK